MQEDLPDREPKVSAEVEISESSFRAKLNLPANLASAIGKNFVKAVSFAAAGIAPERYLRTKNTLSKAKIQDAIAHQICTEITDPPAREAVARSLTLSVLETESRLQRRGEIIDSAKSQLPYFADEKEDICARTRKDATRAHFARKVFDLRFIPHLPGNTFRD